MTDYELFQAIYGPKSLGPYDRYDVCTKLINDWGEAPIDKLIRVCIDILPEHSWQNRILDEMEKCLKADQEMIDKYRILI